MWITRVDVDNHSWVNLGYPGFSRCRLIAYECKDGMCRGASLGARTAAKEMPTMNESHFIRNALLFLVALLVAGWIAIGVFHFLFSIIGYLIVGALVVGGGYYLYGRAKRELRSGRVRRQIRR